MVTLAATEFKARCLAVLDRVCRTGEEVTITKRGRPVARLVAPRQGGARGGGSPLRHPLAGTVEILGDIVGPALPSSAWAALGDRPVSRRPRRVRST